MKEEMIGLKEKNLDMEKRQRDAFKVLKHTSSRYAMPLVSCIFSMRKATQRKSKSQSNKMRKLLIS